MAEGFESYHVPQQSRRDKLRVLDAAANIHGGCSGLFPHYALDSLTYAAGAHDFHHHPHSSSAAGLGGACRTSAVKEEGANLMATSYGGMNGAINFVTSIDASISSNHANYYPDLQSSIPINPPPIQEIRNDSNNPFLYASQNLRNYDHPPHHQSCNGSSLTLTPHDSSIGTTAQGLSLSLSPSSSSYCNGNSTHRTNPPPAALNLEAYDSPASAIFTDIASRRGSISVGYASTLKGSRFLRPAQQLLEEFCVVGCGIYSEKAAMAAMDSLGDLAGINDHDCGNDCGSRKKPRLISILDEVCRKYKQYYQQFQTVVASFESVPGLGNAAPFANLALKALSKHFRSLKNAITDQLLLAAKTHGHISYGKEGSQRIGNTDRGLYSQRTVQNSGFLGNQPIWRTQRGLPERAVTVLRAWLFEHFLHPYPSDGDKLLLAKQTGLSRSQVSNWFINARVRLWKPMVEEIHTLEARQAKTTSQRDEPRNNMPKEQLPSPNSLASENPSTSSAQSMLDAQYKGSSTRDELPDELADLSYRDASNDGHVASGVGAAARGSSGVSLTLGLPKGVGLSEPFPVGPAQHFGLGLDPNDGGYVTASGFEAQNRQLGRDVFGGQLLHDFVG